MARRARWFVLILLLAASTSFSKTRSAFPISHGQSTSGIVHAVDGARIAILGGAVVIDATEARIVSSRGDAGLAAIVPGVRIHVILKTAQPAESGALRAEMIVVDDPPEGNLTGPIQSIDLAASRFRLLGATLTVTSETVFVASLLRDSAFKLADLHPDDPVSVDVATSPSGLLAQRVTLLHPSPRPGVHLAGIVKTIGPDQWVIAGRNGADVTIKITPETKIAGNPNVGDEVEVFGHVDSANQLVAISIVKVDRTPRPFAFRGTVRSITPERWTIGAEGTEREIVVAITPETKIAGSPAVGDWVEVMAHVDAAGHYVAISIVKSVPPRPVILITGTVKSIGANEWTLTDDRGSDVALKITEATKIDPTIQLGDRVEAMATRDEGGALVALAIVRFPQPPPSHESRFDGVVRAIDGSIWLVDSIKVIVSPMTRIVGDPHVGDRVRVTGWKSRDGSFLATSIEKLP